MLKAEESNFLFLKESFYTIPFFQRSYVWKESNWKELVDNLLDRESNHFLGSIIIRNEVSDKKYKLYSIIDGQQRLTTISILIRVCYDIYHRTKQLSPNEISLYEQELGTMIFRWTKDEQKKLIRKVVIEHSLIDAPYFKKVISEGLTKDEMDEITLDSEMEKEKNQKKASKSTNNAILKCYKYFYKLLDNDTAKCDRITELLCTDSLGMIVKITIDENDNEQSIFDTINTAGVRLSCADTIKNSIFQKAMEYATTPELKDYIIRFYKNTWEKTFSADDDTVIYWNTEIQLGRYKRNNIEILLQSVALIKGFYNPEKNPIYKIADLYKEHIKELIRSARDNNDFAIEAVKYFVDEIVSYALIFKKYFTVMDDDSSYNYDDGIERLFCILSAKGITALHPYLLKLLKERDDSTDSNAEFLMLEEFKKIETYVVRSIVCGVPVANFNKECPALIKGTKTVEDYITEKNLTDDNFKAGLLKIKDNTTAKILLFWIELYRVSLDDKADKNPLVYSKYTLEHIMPKTWEKYWGINTLPVKNPISGTVIKKEEDAHVAREAAIYELGNMALLTQKLNSSISNYEIERKMYGVNNRKVKNPYGIEHYATLFTTKEIVKIYKDERKWDEKIIRDRTCSFYDTVISMWQI